MDDELGQTGDGSPSSSLLQCASPSLLFSFLCRGSQRPCKGTPQGPGQHDVPDHAGDEAPRGSQRHGRRERGAARRPAASGSERARCGEEAAARMRTGEGEGAGWVCGAEGEGCDVRRRVRVTIVTPKVVSLMRFLVVEKRCNDDKIKCSK